MKTTGVMRIVSLLAGAGLTLACSSSPEVVSGNDGFHSASGGATASGGSLSFNLGGGTGTGTSGDGHAGDGETCATSSAEVELTPLDMALAVDTSYSMDFEDKWAHVRGALK